MGDDFGPQVDDIADVPDCRATFIDANGNETLINRNDEGDMGCISHAECIQYTGPDSWCKADGTCRGCEDWTGCCDLGNTPIPEIPCIDLAEPLIDANHRDVACAGMTGCENSYCQEDSNTCFPCEPTPNAPNANDFASPCIGLGMIEAYVHDNGHEICRAITECPESECLFQSEPINVEDAIYLSFGFCFDRCDGEMPGHEIEIPNFCLLAEDEDAPFNNLVQASLDGQCQASTNCSSSFCKSAGDSLVNGLLEFGFAGEFSSYITGVGHCHECEADGAAENPEFICGITGSEEADNSLCRFATGCSGSYCKSNNRCYVCDADAPDSLEQLVPCSQYESTGVADTFCQSPYGTGCLDSFCKENGFCQACNEIPSPEDPLPCAFEVSNPLVANWDDWCSQDCDDESFAVCQPNNQCGPCVPTPVFAGDDRIENREEPECRQGFDFNGVFHLISRNGEGDMGCISDQECIDNTAPSSWCKADGTCAGCEDWTGCCDLTPVPVPDQVP